MNIFKFLYENMDKDIYINCPNEENIFMLMCNKCPDKFDCAVSYNHCWTTISDICTIYNIIYLDLLTDGVII